MSRPSAASGCAVAAGHALTVGAAAEILRAGGNAVEAAIAGLWMACVCEPVLASPGGGGFMMVLHRDASRASLIDFFVQTPAVRPPGDALDFHAVHADFGTTRQEFHVGAGSAAVPGFIPGIFAAHEAHGRMPMPELAAPAIAAARQGIAQTPFQARLLKIIAPILTHSPSARALFAPQGQLLAAGETMRNPDLADALDAVVREGARLATEGEIAAAMLAAAQAGGAVTRDDLARYQAQWRVPVLHDVADAQIFLNPPPSCGGTLIAAMLEALGPLHTAPDAIALARGMAHVDGLWRGAHGDLGRFARQRVRSRGTTHVSVVDRDGMAVAATVSNGEGNGHIVPGCGFMLNNMLGEEDLNPGGFHRWPVASRLSSMMAPGIMRTRDGALTAFGSGGSNRIRTALFQTLARLLADRDGDLAGLVALPRLHVETGHLHFEDFFTNAQRQALCETFPDHTVWPERSMFFGGVHLVRLDPQRGVDAAGDTRRDGQCYVG